MVSNGDRCPCVGHVTCRRSSVPKDSQLPVIVKRDQTTEPFSSAKIQAAVLKCFASCAEPPAAVNAGKIAAAVEKVTKKKTQATVEEIQDLVEVQLMNLELHEALRHYILYRDERRKLRIDIDPVDAAFVRDQKQYFPTELQAFQFADKYARFNVAKGRRETWPEAVDRVITFFQNSLGAQAAFEIGDSFFWSDIRNGMLNMEAMPSMRVLQMAGPALDRCHVGVYNCAYVALDSLQKFPELLYVLMQGTGVGFSVEGDYVSDLPKIKRQVPGPKATWIVGDNTEGWCDALKKGLETWFNGGDIEFDYSRIRAAGTPLKTKGGRASGPAPLRELLTFIRNKVLANQGRRLSPIDVHDIACYCGRIVEVGGVRRAAQISLSDLDDVEMQRAKFGNFYSAEPQRANANNSAVYDEKPSAVQFMGEFLSLAESGSGERGIFNRGGALQQIPKRRRKATFGVNPCGEILLRDREFCNLSIAIARPDDTEEDLVRKVRLATIIGTLQSTLTNFAYISPEWKKNCEEERLLGVDINGQMDCHILRPPSTYGDQSMVHHYTRMQLLEKLKRTAVDTNELWAKRLGIKPSVAVTCVKPSGNSSVLFNVSPGLHARHAPYYIRRVTVSANGPMAHLLTAESVPHQVSYSNNANLLFEFPVKAPEGAIVKGALSALEQLWNWRDWKQYYTEHNPSVTITVKPDEWLAVGNWVYENWAIVGGLSLLPASDSVYAQAPYEEITAAEYEKRAAAFPAIDYAKLAYYEHDDQTTVAQDFACVGDHCETA